MPWYTACPHTPSTLYSVLPPHSGCLRASIYVGVSRGWHLGCGRAHAFHGPDRTLRQRDPRRARPLQQCRPMQRRRPCGSAEHNYSAGLEKGVCPGEEGKGEGGRGTASMRVLLYRAGMHHRCADERGGEQRGGNQRPISHSRWRTWPKSYARDASQRPPCLSRHACESDGQPEDDEAEGVCVL